MRGLFAGVFIVAATLFAPISGVASPGLNADAAALLSAVSPSSSMEFCGEKVPFQLQDVKERFEKEMLLILWDQPQVLLWLKRSRRYFPEIEKQLKAAHMPEDLKYLAIAESALRPHAGSPRGAIGFWQLMPQTARKYGLRVDERVDQRRALKPSTRAALSYLQELYERLQSWTLAVAAYNMGEEGLVAEMLEQDIRDYYQLYLSLETQRFVFRIVAAKLIFTHPERYGFVLQAKDYYAPRPSEMITLDNFDEVPLRLVAKAADTYFKVIKDLNPELRGHYLPPGSFEIHLPKGASKGFLERFRTMAENHSRDFKKRIYIVKPGDNLSSIAEKYNVPLAALLIWNRLDLKRAIHPGDRLVVRPHKTK